MGKIVLIYTKLNKNLVPKLNLSLLLLIPISTLVSNTILQKQKHAPSTAIKQKKNKKNAAICFDRSYERIFFSFKLLLVLPFVLLSKYFITIHPLSFISNKLLLSNT